MNASSDWLSRREWIGAALGTALAARASGDALSELDRTEAEPAAAAARPRIVDSNLSLFQWPFRRLPLDEPALLVEKLRTLGIARAWAGSFEALLHRDVGGVNQRLAEVCGRFEELVPIGAINLALPDWREDVRRCVEEYNMPGVRVHPAYHGYGLDDERFGDLLSLAADAGRFVQVAASMEDVRTQHPLVQVRDVDLSPLPKVMQNRPQARVQLLNAKLRPAEVKVLAALPGVFVDVARVDGTDGVANAIGALPPGRVLLGSHAPFLIPEAVLIRAWESDLAAESLRGLLWENAEALCR